MNILDRRSFGSAQKIFCLGKWEKETIYLEQIIHANPSIRVRTEAENGVVRSIYSTPLNEQTLSAYELDGGTVRLLLFGNGRVAMIAIDLTQSEPSPLVTEFSFCGTVTGACLVNGTACLVRVEGNSAHQALYQELELFSGRNAFLFYCEQAQECCVLVRDLHFAELNPQEIFVEPAGGSFCAVHKRDLEEGKKEYDPPQLPDCVLWGQWDLLREGLLRGDLELPIHAVQTATQQESLTFIHITEDTLFFSVENEEANRLCSLQRSSGVVTSIATLSNGEQGIFVQGLGCCVIKQEAEQTVLCLSKSERWVLPKSIGIPIAWFENRYVIGVNPLHVVCYDRQERRATVYTGSIQLLPDGFLIN